MSFDSEKLLDHAGMELLRLLHENACMSFADLGKRVGLTPPAVAERMRRMEEAGIITGYRAEVSLDKLGLPIQAFIRVSECEPCERLVNLAKTLPEVRECHMLTGNDSFILRVVVSSVAHLEVVIEKFRHYAKVMTTAIVLATPIHEHAIEAELIGRASEEHHR